MINIENIIPNVELIKCATDVVNMCVSDLISEQAILSILDFTVEERLHNREVYYKEVSLEDLSTEVAKLSKIVEVKLTPTAGKSEYKLIDRYIPYVLKCQIKGQEFVILPLKKVCNQAYSRDIDWLNVKAIDYLYREYGIMQGDLDGILRKND